MPEDPIIDKHVKDQVHNRRLQWCSDNEDEFGYSWQCTRYDVSVPLWSWDGSNGPNLIAEDFDFDLGNADNIAGFYSGRITPRFGGEDVVGEMVDTSVSVGSRDSGDVSSTTSSSNGEGDRNRNIIMGKGQDKVVVDVVDKVIDVEECVVGGAGGVGVGFQTLLMEAQHNVSPPSDDDDTVEGNAEAVQSGFSALSAVNNTIPDLARRALEDASDPVTPSPAFTIPTSSTNPSTNPNPPTPGSTQALSNSSNPFFSFRGITLPTFRNLFTSAPSLTRSPEPDSIVPAVTSVLAETVTETPNVDPDTNKTTSIDVKKVATPTTNMVEESQEKVEVMKNDTEIEMKSEGQSQSGLVAVPSSDGRGSTDRSTIGDGIEEGVDASDGPSSDDVPATLLESSEDQEEDVSKKTETQDAVPEQDSQDPHQSWILSMEKRRSLRESGIVSPTTLDSRSSQHCQPNTERPKKLPPKKPYVQIYDRGPTLSRMFDPIVKIGPPPDDLPPVIDNSSKLEEAKFDTGIAEEQSSLGSRVKALMRMFESTSNSNTKKEDPVVNVGNHVQPKYHPGTRSIQAECLAHGGADKFLYGTENANEDDKPKIIAGRIAEEISVPPKNPDPMVVSHPPDLGLTSAVAPASPSPPPEHDPVVSAPARVVPPPAPVTWENIPELSRSFSLAGSGKNSFWSKNSKRSICSKNSKKSSVGSKNSVVNSKNSNDSKNANDSKNSMDKNPKNKQAQEEKAALISKGLALLRLHYKQNSFNMAESKIKIEESINDELQNALKEGIDPDLLYSNLGLPVSVVKTELMILDAVNKNVAAASFIFGGSGSEEGVTSDADTLFNENLHSPDEKYDTLDENGVRIYRFEKARLVPPPAPVTCDKIPEVPRSFFLPGSRKNSFCSKNSKRSISSKNSKKSNSKKSSDSEDFFEFFEQIMVEFHSSDSSDNSKNSLHSKNSSVEDSKNSFNPARPEEDPPLTVNDDLLDSSLDSPDESNYHIYDHEGTLLYRFDKLNLTYQEQIDKYNRPYLVPDEIYPDGKDPHLEDLWGSASRKWERDAWLSRIGKPEMVVPGRLKNGVGRVYCYWYGMGVCGDVMGMGWV